MNEECRKLDSDLMALAQDEHDRQIAEPQPRRKADTQKALVFSFMCIANFDFGHWQDWSSDKGYWNKGRSGKGGQGKRKSSGYEDDAKRGRW